ncbi:MAG: site-2 protease family protein [Chloroflexi bacterium]|nr:site-2 protease family protein [Chloroflexota bacterium]
MFDPWTEPQLSASAEVEWAQRALRGIMTIEDIILGERRREALRVRGRLLVDAEEAYERLAPVARARGRTLLLRREGEDILAIFIEGVIRPEPNNRWVPILLAILTVISVHTTYVLLWVSDEFSLAGLWRNLGKGWPFTLSLLGILLTHELGHYFMARHHGVAVTLPYLIPFPMSLFGTMGAVIRMKDIPPSRRAMLRIGAAGPLAGLLVAVPITLIGLSLSEVGPLPPEGGYVMEGNSLLYALLKIAVFGRFLPSGGEDVLLHAMALAGWAGLLVTSFNLMPAGQLDGGHVAYALWGRWARYATWGVIGLLVVLGLVVWQGWLIWAGLVFFFARQQVAPLNDVSTLSAGEKALAVLILALFVLMFTPLPLKIVA